MATPGVTSCATTPKSTNRRSARRSWFETPPATRLQIAVEKPQLKTMNSRSKRRSIDDVETLVLSHFTKPPRISFGKILVGRSKTRILLIQNPADYDQEVVIERFPYKKYFNVDQTHFVVGAEEVVSLTLTWTPQDSGGCREMVLFHINDVYRLQAYVFGTAEDPKPVKKGRKGMMGTRKKQPSVSVVQTKSLNSIRDNYSPRRSEETRELRSQVKPIHALHMDQENVQPADLEELPPQTPPPLESTAICRSDERQDQNAYERRKSGFISPTLSKMSPIPVMADHNNGCVIESYFSTTARSNTPNLEGKESERSPLRNMAGSANRMSDSSSKSLSKHTERSDSRHSGSNKQKMISAQVKSAETGTKVTEKSGVKAKLHVSPNSFLNDSLAAQTAATTPEIGRVGLSSQVARVANMATVSPNSFLEDMGTTKPTAALQRSSIPSPSTVLNDSIPHDIMVRQLEFVRNSLHDGSFHKSLTPRSATVTKGKPASKPHPQDHMTDRLSQLAQPKARNVKKQAVAEKKERFLHRKICERAQFAKITDAPSPRRKTFLVNKKQQTKKVSPLKDQTRNTKNKRNTAREASNTQSAADNKRNLFIQDTEDDEHNKNNVCKQTAEDTDRVVGKTVKDGRGILPDDSDIKTNNCDDSMIRRRRSLWASPAVAGFEPPLLACRSDCDSTGEEFHSLENPAQSSSAEYHTKGQGLHVKSQHLLVNKEKCNDLSAAQPKESEGKGRHSSGRRLFPDVVSDDLNISKDFKPLWAGSSTVTKDRPSISPRHSDSANSSKKLFPDIGTEVPLDVENVSSHVGRSVEEVDNRNVVIVDMADIADLSSTSNTLLEGKKRKSGPSVDSGKNQREKNDVKAEDYMNYQWNSPQQLLNSPVVEAHRRATLTVTKPGPSQALLDHAANFVNTKETQEPALKTIGKVDIDEMWQTETIVIETRNSEIVRIQQCREVFTPTELPTSPKSENSRRSTHAIRNPVVLNKENLMPKNLFSVVSESDPQDKESSHEAEPEAERNMDKRSSLKQQDDVEVCRDKNQCTMPASENQDSPTTLQFTDRKEQHLIYQRNKIVRSKSSTQFSATEVAVNNSLSSQELSLDSLEKTSTSREEDICTDDMNVEAQDCRTKDDNRFCSGTGNSSEFVTDQNRSIENAKRSGTDMAKIAPTAMLSYSTTQAESSGTIQTRSQQLCPSAGKESSKFSVEMNDTVDSKKDVDMSESEDQCLPHTTDQSLISAETKTGVSGSSDKLSRNWPGPSDDPRKEKLTTAKPNLSPVMVKEMLLKENAEPDTGLVRDLPSSISFNREIKTVHKGKFRRSVSADLHSKSLQTTQAGKKPTTFTFKESSSTSSLNQKGKPTLATQPSTQILPRTRSQSNLDAGRQAGRPNKKRSSPEAGLKEPHSKRVEMEPCRLTRKSIQPPSRVSTTGKSKTERAAKPSKGVALSKLILVKKSKTALPKHPLPFAAKNMYYDERWQDKQERGFVHWLNFVLTPTDEYVLATNKTKVDARTIAFDGAANKVAPRLAPTKEILSFRAYAARRRLNHLRRSSCRLFQSEEVVRVVCRLELEVEQRRLAVRADRMIHADIGLKQKILDMLLSYNPLWLRVGLETVYGEILPIQANVDVIGISRFILTRLLTSPDISAHYAHPTVPHLYHDGYADAIAQHTLKKFLVLVYFLDCAKQSRLIAHDPCLFCKDAEIKSTKAMLIQFSRDFLSGEGDITKHLAYMGYVVSHVQTPLDEFDYAVTNLCTDLRDGLRLGRILMLLSGDWSFASSLRAPAISRLQKIHNVELVFKHLTKRGFDFSTAKGGVINPRDIVDGHREKTLAFLWRLIFHFQTVAMLNEQELQEEVDMLERTLHIKLCMQRLLGSSQNAESMARRDSGGPSVAMDSPMLQLLLRWCKNVCLHYGVKVENFTVSFSDGRALCCLLHHYHPSLLPLQNIQFRTSQSVQQAAESAGEVSAGEGDSDLSQDWGAYPMGDEIDQSVFERLLANEKENFRILYEKVSELGGIPLMLKASDMSNTIPDERVVVTYVSYMCARLLDLREETKAARIIQMAWRRFCLRRSARLRQKQVAACVVIQRAWRQHCAAVTRHRQETAATRLQALWRGRQGRIRAALLKQAQMNSALHEAATGIQATVRCFQTRQRYLHKNRSALTIQSWFRACRDRRAFLRQKQACVLIQTCFRTQTKAAAVRREYMKQRQCAVTIQRAFRQRQVRVMDNQNRAASVLQRFWRGRQCRQEFLRQREASVCIQAWWRAIIAQKQFVMLRTAVTIIQRQFRAARLGKHVREEFLKHRHAAIVLQKYARGSCQRRRFCQLRNSALMIQKNFRCFKYRIKFCALRLATIIIQRAVRAHLARTVARWQFITMKQAAIVIQRWFRQQRKRQAMKREAAATMIQACLRGYLARKEAKDLRHKRRRETAAATIQTFYRSAVAHRQLQALQARRNTAACKIQAGVRGFIARQQAHSLRMEALQLRARREWAAVRIQSAFRQYLAMKTLKTLRLEAKRRVSAIKIQSAFRRYLAIKTLKTLRLEAKRRVSAIKIQSAFRQYLAMKTLKTLRLEAKRKVSAIKIQSAFRRYLAMKTLKTLRLEAKMTVSAIKIQTFFRCYMARRREAAATKIQAFVKGCLQRKRFAALQRSVLLLQTYARGQQARQNFQQTKEVLLMLAEYQQTRDRFQAVISEYHQRWNAAVTLQAAWRGREQRHNFSKTKSAATKLQAAVRGHAQRKHYLLLRKSAITVQRRFRAQRLGRATRLQYQLMLGAAVVIQSCWKMYVVRSMYRQVRATIISAQAICRGFLACRRYQKLRQAAVCLQRRWRARMLGRKAERDFHKSRQAIIRLQSMVRGRQQRRCFQKQLQSCVKIQSAVRRWLAQRCYQTQYRAAIKLQQCWRATLLCRKEMKRYTAIRQAAVTIEAYTRGWLSRRQVQRHHHAASMIQHCYRGWQARKKFLRLRQATVTLQRHLRSSLLAQQQQKAFAETRQACVKIQSAYRGYVARRSFLQDKQRAVKVQALVRGFLQRKRYLQLYRAAMVCQSLYRAKRLGLVFHTAFLMIRDSAIVVQKHVRGRRARQEYQRMRSAVIILQAYTRGWLQRRQLTEQTQAALCIQRWWRNRTVTTRVRQDYLKTKCAAVTVQRSWRALQQRRAAIRTQAASVIQKHYRRMVVQKKFRDDMSKIVSLQACVRGYLVRKSVSAKLNAVHVIQRRWRETQLTRQCRQSYLLKLGAAIVIQSVFRGHRTRIYFNIAVRRITFLQAAFKGCLQRKRYTKLRRAVISLQQRVRSNAVGHQQRERFLHMKKSAVLIQRAFRQWQERKTQFRTQAATCIQSHFRMLPIRREFLHKKNAVIVLQAAVRAHHARQVFQQKKSAIIFIQKRVRFFIVVRQLHQEVHRRRQAAVTIQRAFRKHCLLMQARQADAACRIQAAFRGFSQRQKFLRKKQAAVTLQCSMRGWRDRRRVTEIRTNIKAAVLIQTCFRDWKRRREEQWKQAQRAQYLQQVVSMARHHLSVIMIQRWYRRCIIVRQAQQQLYYVILLQRRIRAFLQRVRYLRAQQEARELRVKQERAARIIQSAVRKWRVLQEDRRRVKLITKIQAIWRGRQLRRSLKSKKIAAARKRVHEANQKATEEKTLGNRTTSALDFLLHYKQLAYILDALMHLDVATRLSWVCCERLVEVNAVSVIYRLILSCNRSLPHMELIKFSISILLNLAKYEKTASAVYEVENSVSTLVDLMSIYREKGGAIFTKICMLLGILGSDPQRKAEICADKHLVDKLQSIHALVLRKHRMQVARARVAARTSLNATLPSRLLAPKQVKVQPAWVLRRDSMHEIEDPMAALSFLLNTLHIGPK